MEIQVNSTVWYFWQGYIWKGKVERVFDNSIIVDNRGVEKKFVKSTHKEVLNLINSLGL